MIILYNSLIAFKYIMVLVSKRYILKVIQDFCDTLYKTII